VAELKAAQEKAMSAAQKLFEKMYEQAQGAGAGGAGPDMSQFTGAGGEAGPEAGASDGPSADDVVNGDFKEV
ncbi:MAG: molecular chaperone DnaK, partial [Lachnospiraceae bacterium]|nr:molecular chaperone DnaK [Lachnospiraceae bacterium]